MSIPSNTHRPHVGMIKSAPIARDAVPADRDEAIRQLIALAPEDERADLEALLLGDADRGHDGDAKPMVMHAQDAALAVQDRLVSLARAGRLDEFAALAFGLPHLNRVEAPISNAPLRRAPVAQDAFSAAVAADAAREAAAEATALFPNMHRI